MQIPYSAASAFLFAVVKALYMEDSHKTNTVKAGL